MSALEPLKTTGLRLKATHLPLKATGLRLKATHLPLKSTHLPLETAVSGPSSAHQWLYEGRTGPDPGRPVMVAQSSNHGTPADGRDARPTMGQDLGSAPEGRATPGSASERRATRGSGPR